MKTEALKVVPKENNETEDAAKNCVKQRDLYNMVCRMSVIVGALAAVNEDLVDAAGYTLVGCERLSRDLLANLKEIMEGKGLRHEQEG